MIKILYIVLGFFFIFLGALGVIFPMLPAVPFFLAAIFFLARGSDRFSRWFQSTSLYKNHVESFAQNRAMTMKTKISILGVATFMLSWAFVFTDKLAVKIVLVGLVAAKYYYFIFKIRTIRRKKNDSIQKRLMDLAKLSKKYIILTVFYNWLGLLCNVTVMAAMAFLMQSAFEKTLSASLLTLFLMLIGAAVLLRFLCIRLGTKFSHRAAVHAKKLLRSEIYGKLLKIGMVYREKASTASLVQMSVEGVEQLQAYFGSYLPQLYYSLVAPVTLFCLMSFVSIKVALVLLVCVPLIPLSMISIQGVSKKLMRKYWGKYTDLGKGFLESLQGLTTLKIYDADQARHKEMNASAEHFRKITMKVLRLQLNSVSLMDLIAYGGTAAGIIAAVTEAGRGNLALWSGICVILLSWEFFSPLRLLGSFFHISTNGIAAGEKIFAFLDMEEEEDGQETMETFDIQMAHCCFAYDEDRKILKDISLSIPAGGFISIVGESGSGKSTIAGILAGVHREYEGSVRIGGKEVNRISRASIMKNVSLIEHNGYIFKGTVADNLLMGCPGASEEAMKDALKKVKLYDFVMTQGGLDMKIQEQGANLSGGQRQRLSIARAFLHDSDIYIFDEATSNIDAESEACIMQAIFSLAGKKTVILISHRMAAASGAECIYVCKDGLIVGEGKHGMLHCQSGYYARLYNSQHRIENFLKEGEGAVYA